MHLFQSTRTQPLPLPYTQSTQRNPRNTTQGQVLRLPQNSNSTLPRANSHFFQNSAGEVYPVQNKKTTNNVSPAVQDKAKTVYTVPAEKTTNSDLKTLLQKQGAAFWENYGPILIKELGSPIASKVMPVLAERLGPPMAEKIAFPLLKKVGLPIAKRVGLPLAKKLGGLLLSKIGL